MPELIDYTNKRFGRVVVLKRHFLKNDERKYPSTEWELKCDCGEIFTRRSTDIRAGLVYECPNCIFRRSQFYMGEKKFGRLLILDQWRMSRDKNGHKYREWYCQCECGTKKWIRWDCIRKKTTVSCGCYVRKNNARYVNNSLYPKKHLGVGRPAYHLWLCLVQKCYNPKNQSYRWYGGEGYTVCDQWRNDFNSFEEWLNQNKWRTGLTIDIKENYKQFNPTTAVLIRVQDLMNKNKEKNNLEKYGIEFNGKKQSLFQLAKDYKIPYKRLYVRLRQGMSLEEALTRKSYKNTGIHVRRNDISDDEIKKMYLGGMTMMEIEAKLNFNPHYRLKKMKIKMRPAHK